jgi:hypothetical protein
VFTLDAGRILRVANGRQPFISSKRSSSMTRQFIGSLATMILAGGATAPALAEDARPIDEMSADERTIRSLEAQEATAVLDGDTAALEELMSEQTIVNNPQNGITPNRAGVLDLIKRGLISYSSFHRRIEAVRFNGDIAIVMGLEIVVPKGDAPRAGQTVRRRYTNIWKRSGSTWLSIARHANVIAEAEARDRKPGMPRSAAR